MTESPSATQRSPRQRARLVAAIAALSLVLLGGGLIWRFGWQRPDSALDPHQPSPGPQTPSASGPPMFRDVTAASGVDFTYRNGEEADQYTILETLGGGVGLLDFDGDGLLDFFVTGGGYFDGPDKTTIRGHPCKLFRNLGNLKFQDVTRAAGLDIPWWYTHGVAVSDYDRDGWPDLLVTGFGRLGLFHNEPDGKGGRRLVDVTEMVGVRDDSWSTSAGWADLDGDGYPDLYVCHYLDWSFKNNPHCRGTTPGVAREVCGPLRFKPLVHALYQNDRGTKFRDVSQRYGSSIQGNGLGVVLADLNDDRRPDIYAVNDLTSNILLLNRPGGKLDDKGALAGVAVNDQGQPTGSMGVDAADYDGSGRPALWVTTFEKEMQSLYGNLGREVFQYRSWAAGVGALNRNLVGWGTGFVDADNDGWQDLVIICGHLYRNPATAVKKQRPLLLRNGDQQNRRAFTDVSDRSGDYFQVPVVGRGLAVGDLDNDGWPDLIVSHVNSPVAIVRNEGGSASKNRWLGIRLLGKGQRDVVGSTVILEREGRKQTSFVKGGGSYLSASDPRVVFGLGDGEAPVRLTVHWSYGESQTWDGLEPGSYWDLHEREPKARRREPTATP